MTKKRLIPLIVFILFLTWSLYLSQGYYHPLDFLKAAFINGPSTQVATDLTIALSMVLIWIYYDTKKHNRRFLPYLILTILFGSMGPLLYFIIQPNHQTPANSH